MSRTYSKWPLNILQLSISLWLSAFFSIFKGTFANIQISMYFSLNKVFIMFGWFKAFYSHFDRHDIDGYLHLLYQIHNQLNIWILPCCPCEVNYNTCMNNIHDSYTIFCSYHDVVILLDLLLQKYIPMYLASY